MTTQEIIDGLQNILSYCRYHENAPALREAIRILTEMLETEDAPDTNVDTISRQAAIDEIRKCRFVVDAIKKIRGLPSTQPELIEKEAYIRGFEQGRTQGMIDSQGGKK